MSGLETDGGLAIYGGFAKIIYSDISTSIEGTAILGGRAIYGGFAKVS